MGEKHLIRYIMLDRGMRKNGKRSHFAILAKFSVRAQSTKFDPGNVLSVSILAWKISQEEIDGRRISTTRHIW